MTRKYSRQRELIKSFLQDRKDHPTAETVYFHVKQVEPNISLGTVYRNLTLLADLGEIRRIRMGDGVDHFDADTSPHYHFICNECGGVSDLEVSGNMPDPAESVLHFPGRINGHVTYFYGVCEDCCEHLSV